MTACLSEEPSRRQFLAGCAAAGIVLGLQGCGPSDGEPTPPLGEQESFRQPPVVRSSAGVLNTTLEMRRADNFIGTRHVQTQTYNGLLPGPTWQVRPGDVLRFRLINNMTLPLSAPQAFIDAQDAGLPLDICTPADSGSGAPFVDLMGFQRRPLAIDPRTVLLTNIHTHGLQVDPRGDGDNPFVDLAPGQSKDYEIRIPLDHPAGLFWYHPHRHMASSRAGWNGLAGAIVVEGGIDRIPEIAALTTRLMVVNELILDRDGQVPLGMFLPVAGEVPFTTVPASQLDIHFPINGVVEPTLAIAPGEVQRWRLLNASPHRALDLELEGHKLFQIAQDGINFTAPRERSRLLVAAGNRVEFLVVGAAAGAYRLLARSRDQGHPGGARPELVLGHLQCSGAAAPPQAIPATLPASVEPDIGSDAIANTWAVRFKGGILSGPVAFTLNGQRFDQKRLDGALVVGQTDHWRLVNEDVFEHPFHIHVNPFQVVQVNDQPYAEPDVWWDTFPLPARGTVTIRTRYRADVVGKTVYHCHILPHEDNGMMSAITLNAPGGAFVDRPATPPSSTGRRPLPPGIPRRGGNPKRPFVFTQVSHGCVATVPVGALVQVQLPGGPGRWRILSIDSTGVTSVGAAVIPSPGRIAGSDSIYQFDFAVQGDATVTLLAEPAVDPLPNPFVLPIRVG